MVIFSEQFRIPEVLKERIQTALDNGQTNYHTIGIPEIRRAVRLYKNELGLDYPEVVSRWARELGHPFFLHLPVWSALVRQSSTKCRAGIFDIMFI